ncbi:type IV pilus biogenesis protein PilP [Lelliottia aquatilis]|uniref:type IV pilus biogenesis protein PilP n=1 Tax=Lelliottia aquatilis TaxID=2080838 RepID=UPI0015764602|nr:type IV pilus biogenesis protein PilP [Lelliottia aquatilis]NTZ47724.1 type IV pilus biogenesis protein PilP [Lelliottia aquatilis]
MQKINALWVLMAITTSVYAADSPSESGTLGQLEVIQQQNILLNGQAETARLQKQIRDSGQNQQDVTLSDSPAGTSSARSGSLPTIDSITGRGSPAMATLQLENGARVDVKTGEKIPGTGWTVTQITLNGVWIGNGQTVAGLAFSQ